MRKLSLSLAQFKKACMVMPKEIAHWPCQTRYDVIRRNADECLNQGHITESVHKAAYHYATQQLLK